MTEPVNPTLVPALSTLFPDAGDLDTFDARAAALFDYLVSTMAPGSNTIAEQAYTNALAALEAAQAAYINANFKGAWSGLVGALIMPAMVSHAGERWNLLNDLADVTASEPGVSADWELFELPAAIGVGFDPTGTSRTATNVQDVLEDISEDADVALIDFENPVLNGDMRVAQAGTSFAIAAAVTVKTLDGFAYSNATDATLTVSQQAAPTPDNPNAKWQIATVNTADAAISAAQASYFVARTEGFDVADYVGKTFTVSCWVKSSVTGVHSVALWNGTVVDRYFIGECNILVANTPQKFTLTVPGGLPASGTWDFTNGIGLQVLFVLACGSNRFGATGSWGTGVNHASSAQVNALATIGNVFGITDVQICPGTVAKQFKRPTYQASLARCQRYYRRTPFFMNGYGVAGTVASQMLALAPPMRSDLVTPTQLSPSFGNCTATSLFLMSPGGGVCRSVTVTATGNYAYDSIIVIDARF
jgi:hypothetical protein